MSENKRRVIVITGGGSGIGRAAAATFAAEGEQVVILGRTESKIQIAARELGADVAWYRADVSQREQVAEVVANIVEQFGKIDVLVDRKSVV